MSEGGLILSAVSKYMGIKLQAGDKLDMWGSDKYQDNRVVIKFLCDDDYEWTIVALKFEEDDIYYNVYGQFHKAIHFPSPYADTWYKSKNRLDEFCFTLYPKNNYESYEIDG